MTWTKCSVQFGKNCCISLLLCQHDGDDDDNNHRHTVETLYSTIYYSKYFIELNIDKSTQYVAL